MDAEMKSPMSEKIVEKKVYEEGGNKKEYASKGLAGTALGLGIGGLALALMNGGIPAFGSRAMFGGLTPGIAGGYAALPEIVNINVDKNSYQGGTLNEPTALSVLEKENQDEVNLLHQVHGLSRSVDRQFYNARNTDVAEKFSLYKGYMDGFAAMSDRVNRDLFSLYKSQTDADFGLYKSQIDADFRLYQSQINGDFANYKAMSQGDAALKDAMVLQGFNLYKNQRDLYDAVDAKYAAKFCELDKKVAVMEAVRPYQDKILMGDMARYYERGINYVDRKTCRCIYGDVVLPSTPTTTGFQSANPFGCNCGQRVVAAAETTPTT